MKLIITAEVGAGDDFLTTVIEAVNDENSQVYVQVAGEYGHLYVEEIEVIEE